MWIQCCVHALTPNEVWHPHFVLCQRNTSPEKNSLDKNLYKFICGTNFASSIPIFVYFVRYLPNFFIDKYWTKVRHTNITKIKWFLLTFCSQSDNCCLVYYQSLSYMKRLIKPFRRWFDRIKNWKSWPSMPAIYRSQRSSFF